MRELLAVCGSTVGPELRRMERAHEGAFVVDDAAAEQVPFAARERIGLERPPRARWHDVDVADDADLRVALAGQVSVADIPFAIVRIEAPVRRYGKRLVERRLRTWTERGARRSRVEVFDAFHAHERFDVVEHVAPVRVAVRVDFRLDAFIGPFHAVLPFPRESWCLQPKRAKREVPFGSCCARGARGEIRTLTVSQRFLRPPRLPFRHSGAHTDYSLICPASRNAIKLDVFYRENSFSPLNTASASATS